MTHPKLADAMSRPDFYPHRPSSVEVIQTHISFIFIADDCVYKVKKAVDFGFLDFTTLEKRRFYCREELRLNKRLAPDFYLEVIDISEDAGGNIVMGPGGKVIEYAVKMKRLPTDRMLKGLLSRGRVVPADMERVARRVSEFHRLADTGGRIDENGGLDVIRKNQDENFDQTEKYIGMTIPEEQYRFIQSFINDFMDRNRALFERRVEEHRIRDCHGDLHIEHICLADGIVIFDCIEFNERFRFGDVAAEVAFLAMDLDFNGYPDHARAFVDAYVRLSGDPELTKLLNFYRTYYAYVRGKVISFRLDDRAIDEKGREEAKDLASRYFDLAYAYAARPEGKTLILTAGLMGTGKSVLASRLASRLDAEVIRMDVLRKEMCHIAPTEHRYEDFGKGIYSGDVSRKAYERALEAAALKLREGRSVIIDASFKNRAERRRAAQIAAELRADFFIVECVLPDRLVTKRLAARMSEKGEVSDGRTEILEAQKRDFERIDEVPARSHIVIDTSEDPERCACRVLAEIRKRRMP
ncbi:MAG TPA: AAA family ATPase [Syntrophales bacterium]|nr:AAA family ATPase [Syntrophales bacterium]HPI56170.1 AAA family ATPase [Syntrophales bacterium]HPN24358.1 AAA family ATPase [Syntrophales bacterium]